MAKTPKQKEPSRTVHVSMPVKLIEAIDSIARSKSLNSCAMIRMALIEWISDYLEADHILNKAALPKGKRVEATLSGISPFQKP